MAYLEDKYELDHKLEELIHRATRALVALRANNLYLLFEEIQLLSSSFSEFLVDNGAKISTESIESYESVEEVEYYDSQTSLSLKEDSEEE